jgi:hypothetical protein
MLSPFSLGFYPGLGTIPSIRANFKNECGKSPPLQLLSHLPRKKVLETIEHTWRYIVTNKARLKSFHKKYNFVTFSPKGKRVWPWLCNPGLTFCFGFCFLCNWASTVWTGYSLEQLPGWEKLRKTVSPWRPRGDHGRGTAP